MRKQNILIIGGSRFVGPLLIQKLLSGDHSITVFNRGLVSSDYPSAVRFIKGDRNAGFNMPEHFDAVIDMCAYSGAQTKCALKELNFDFFLHMSTAAAYQKPKNFPLTEDSPLGGWPLWSDYNRGKAECENVLAKSGVEFAVLRPVYILGPRNYCNREAFIYSRIKNGPPLVLPGNGQALIHFVFADEVADSLAFLAEKKIGGAFNCAGDDVITLRELTEEMGKIIGKKPIIEYNPSADGAKWNFLEFPFANENFIVSNEKIKKMGIKFTPLIKGLKEDYENYYNYV
ncbi:MAG: NAD-dependent epimerase/dehydratase family protein [Parcubacteria group bacterium]|nr:NAD-dependent epimerase/dehydratase family protein [Parcubacteria group bacterium]